MNPYGVLNAPRYDPAALAAWTAEVEAARREYADHPHFNGCSPSHDCHHMRAKRYAR